MIGLALAAALISSVAPYGESVLEDFGASGINPPAGTTGYWPSPSTMIDSGPAIQSAIDAAPLGGVIRAGKCRYHSNQTLYLKRDVTIVFGPAESITHAMCGIRFSYGIPGIVLDSYAFVTLRGVTVSAKSRPPSTAPAPSAHGITIKGLSYLEGVYVTQFDGDGIHIEASVPASNANQWRINGGASANNKGWGLFTRGSDSNAGVAVGFSAIENALGGIHEQSFLGNEYFGCHTDHNGGPAIESGIYYVDGVRTENRNNASMFLNMYIEDGTYADLGTRTIWIGGYGANSVRGGGAVLRYDGAGFQADHFSAVSAGKTVARLGSLIAGSTNEVFGPASTPIYSTPSAIRAGWVDTTALRGSSAVSYRVSTSSAADGAGQFEAPSGVRVGSSGPKISSGTIAPAIGTWKRGDFLFNSTPSAGSPLGWRCTVAGTPGTWIAVSAP